MNTTKTSKTTKTAAPAPITDRKPVVQESEYKGNPMLVLQWGEDSKYPMQFGLTKAKLILACVEDIQNWVAREEGIEEIQSWVAREEAKAAKKAKAKK